MTPCLRCSVDVLNASLPDGTRITLDEAPSAEGEYGAWMTRQRLAWVWRARHQSDGDRLNDAGLRAVHRCEPAGVQLELEAS